MVARVARVARELPRPRTFLEPAAQPENLISHLDFKVQARVCRINIEYLYEATRNSKNYVAAQAESLISHLDFKVQLKTSYT